MKIEVPVNAKMVFPSNDLEQGNLKHRSRDSVFSRKVSFWPATKSKAVSKKMHFLKTPSSASQSLGATQSRQQELRTDSRARGRQDRYKDKQEEKERERERE